jgi:hypothetical protein
MTFHNVANSSTLRFTTSPTFDSPVNSDHAATRGYVDAKVIGLTTSTDGSGNATVDLTSYSFSANPVVQLTCVRVAADQTTTATITALSTTSLSIHSRQSRTLAIVGATTEPISATVHITLLRA